jgi:hypothetical protein
LKIVHILEIESYFYAPEIDVLLNAYNADILNTSNDQKYGKHRNNGVNSGSNNDNNNNDDNNHDNNDNDNVDNDSNYSNNNKTNSYKNSKIKKYYNKETISKLIYPYQNKKVSELILKNLKIVRSMKVLTNNLKNKNEFVRIIEEGDDDTGVLRNITLVLTCPPHNRTIQSILLYSGPQVGFESLLSSPLVSSQSFTSTGIMQRPNYLQSSFSSLSLLSSLSDKNIKNNNNSDNNNGKINMNNSTYVSTNTYKEDFIYDSNNNNNSTTIPTPLITPFKSTKPHHSNLSNEVNLITPTISEYSSLPLRRLLLDQAPLIDRRGMHKCMYTYMCVCMYIRVYIFIHVYICIYICI